MLFCYKCLVRKKLTTVQIINDTLQSTNIVSIVPTRLTKIISSEVTSMKLFFYIALLALVNARRQRKNRDKEDGSIKA